MYVTATIISGCVLQSKHQRKGLFVCDFHKEVLPDAAQSDSFFMAYTSWESALLYYCYSTWLSV